MGNYILFIIFVIIGYTVIFSLLVVASRSDDEIEELYEDIDTNEKYDYYEERYRNETSKNNNSK